MKRANAIIADIEGALDARQKALANHVSNSEQLLAEIKALQNINTELMLQVNNGDTDLTEAEEIELIRKFKAAIGASLSTHYKHG